MPSVKHEKGVEFFERTVHGFQRKNLCKKISLATDSDIPYRGYIPDGFMIDHEKRTLHLFEVDGSSYTNALRLSKLEALWWEIDGAGWFMNLTILDLGTGAISKFDNGYFTQMVNDQSEKNRVANGTMTLPEWM